MRLSKSFIKEAISPLLIFQFSFVITIRVEVNGSNMEVGFNPRYFIEALRVIDDELVDIYFNSSVGPCTIRPLEGDSFAYMILPVRINK